MSRSFTAATLRAMFSQESNDTLMSALVVKYDSLQYADNAIRIVDNFTHKFTYLTSTTCTVVDIRNSSSSTYTYTSSDAFVKAIINNHSSDLEDFYGSLIMETVNGTWKTVMYLFIPFELTLPADESGTIPTAKLVVHDITQYLTPIIRTIFEPPQVTMRLVLYSDTSVIPIEFEEFYMSVFNYDKDTVSADITIESYVSEPFPAHSFTPSIFPGAF